MPGLWLAGTCHVESFRAALLSQWRIRRIDGGVQITTRWRPVMLAGQTKRQFSAAGCPPQRISVAWLWTTFCSVRLGIVGRLSLA